MDVVARMHGGGVSAQAGALRHGISPRAARGRSEPARRAQAPRLPDARPARQGAQEGRPEEGAQAAAVLQALDPAPCARRALRDRRRPRRRRRVPDRRARARPRRAPPRCSRDAERPQVLVVRDTRESGEMLEAALAAGIAAAGGEALLGGVLPTPAAPLLLAPVRLRPRGRHLARRTTRSTTTASSSSTPTAASSPTRPRRRSRQRLDGSRASAEPLDRARARAARQRWRTTCARCTSASPTSTCAGSTSSLDCAHGATYRAAPEIFRRLGRRGRRDRRRARRAQHQRGLRLDPHGARSRERSSKAATTSASPSTATATACWPSTATASSSTATS